MSLFRPEALRQQQGSWLGSIQLTQPLALRWITVGALLCVAAVLVFLFWGEAGRRARLTGVLMPDQGLLRVLAPGRATVARIAVEEGQQVHEGDLLLILHNDDARLSTTAQASLQQTFDARIQSLEAAQQRADRLAAEQARTLAQRGEAVQRELQQLDAQSQLQAQRLALAEQALARLEALARDQFVSTAQVQGRNEEVLALRAESAALRRQREALQRESTNIEAEQRSLPLQTQQQQAALGRERDEVAETAERASTGAARHEWLLRAPADGVVSALHVAAGEAVADRLPLVSILPKGSLLQAQLYAPSSAMAFLQPGLPVHLRLQAFPYQKYGWLAGQVRQVAGAPLLPSEMVALPLARAGAQSLAATSTTSTGITTGMSAGVVASGEPLYKVTVALSAQAVQAGGQLRPLRPGMQLEADVVLERRRLVEWLFEPLLGWRQRL